MRAPSPLPVCLLNVIGSFIGDKYHVLTFSLTLSGNLSAKRIVMQSRIKREDNQKSLGFYYAGTMGMFLHVPYGRYNYTLAKYDEVFCEHVRYKNRQERLKAFLDFTIHLPQVTAHVQHCIKTELAKKFAGNIARLSLRNRVGILGATPILDD